MQTKQNICIQCVQHSHLIVYLQVWTFCCHSQKICWDELQLFVYGIEMQSHCVSLQDATQYWAFCNHNHIHIHLYLSISLWWSGMGMVSSGRLDPVLFTLPSPLTVPQTGSSVLLCSVPCSGEAPLLKSPAAKLGRDWCFQTSDFFWIFSET